MAARDRPRTSGRAALLGLAVGITATIVAWGILVLAAIDFGRDARGGASEGWLLLAAATIGAIACMFLAIIFAARLQARLKGDRVVSRPVVEPADEPRTAPAEVASAPAAPAQVEPAYRSKHSRAAEGPEPEESVDSPAAAYRGKRAAR